MNVCDVCGNAYEKPFRLIAANQSTYVFENFECAIQALATGCENCSSHVIGHGGGRGTNIFCCDDGARAHGTFSDMVSAGPRRARESPALRSSATGRTDLQHDQAGRIGWLLLWAVGIPIPFLLAFYVLGGCT